MTYSDAVKKMDGQSFNFNGDVVTVKKEIVEVSDGRIWIIGSKQDVIDLYEAFKKQ